VSIFNSALGRRVRARRKALGLTMSDVAERMSVEAGSPVSATQIGQWERGERTMSAEQVFLLSRALGCTACLLMDDSPEHLLDRIRSAYGGLNRQEQEIIQYVIRDWDGDQHALLQFVGLYASLPREIRYDIAAMGVHQIHQAEQYGIQTSGPDIDIESLSEAADRLLGIRKR